MDTVLRLTIITTEGPPSPETIADAERVFNTTLTIDGNRAVGDVRLAHGISLDYLKAELEAIPGVKITSDEIVDAT